MNHLGLNKKYLSWLDLADYCHEYINFVKNQFSQLEKICDRFCLNRRKEGVENVMNFILN